jgi:methanogenic corrinoid protein MtbC1
MVELDDALRDTARRKILFAIQKSPQSVNAIAAQTGLKQPNVSNHLSRLKERGIVGSSKEGRQIFYFLASQEVNSMLEASVSVRTAPATNVDFSEVIPLFLDRAVAGDEEGALEVFEQAFKSSCAILDIYEKLLAPAMRTMGLWYQQGQIDEAQEHMGSEITLRCMARTVHIAGPAKRNGKRCVIGCAPMDWHVIGPRMASDVLRLTGWRTLFIGTSVPIRSFLTAVYHNRPDLALISCSTDASVEPAIQLVRELSALRRDRSEFAIGLGGIFPHNRVGELRHAGADFFVSNLRTFVDTIVPELEKGNMVPEDVAWPETSCH